MKLFTRISKDFFIIINMNPEKSPEKKGSLVSFLKKFNKVSAAVLLSAGVILESGPLLALGAIDVGQSYLLGRYEKWRDKRKAAKGAGKAAISGAKA